MTVDETRLDFSSSKDYSINSLSSPTRSKRRTPIKNKKFKNMFFLSNEKDCRIGGTSRNNGPCLKQPPPAFSSFTKALGDIELLSKCSGEIKGYDTPQFNEEPTN